MTKRMLRRHSLSFWRKCIKSEQSRPPHSGWATNQAIPSIRYARSGRGLPCAGRLNPASAFANSACTGRSRPVSRVTCVTAGPGSFKSLSGACSWRIRSLLTAVCLGKNPWPLSPRPESNEPTRRFSAPLAQQPPRHKRGESHLAGQPASFARRKSATNRSNAGGQRLKNLNVTVYGNQTQLLMCVLTLMKTSGPISIV